MYDRSLYYMWLVQCIHPVLDVIFFYRITPSVALCINVCAEVPSTKETKYWSQICY